MEEVVNNWTRKRVNLGVKSGVIFLWSRNYKLYVYFHIFSQKLKSNQSIRIFWYNQIMESLFISCVVKLSNSGIWVELSLLKQKAFVVFMRQNLEVKIKTSQIKLNELFTYRPTFQMSGRYPVPPPPSEFINTFL